jgi:hypothetical protein
MSAPPPPGVRGSWRSRSRSLYRMLATRGVGPRRGHWHWQSESPHELRLQLEVFEHAERQVDILPIEHSILRAFVWQLRSDLGALVVSRPVDSKTASGPQVSQADSQLPYNMKFCPNFTNHYDNLKLARESRVRLPVAQAGLGPCPQLPYGRVCMEHTSVPQCSCHWLVCRILLAHDRASRPIKGSHLGLVGCNYYNYYYWMLVCGSSGQWIPRRQAAGHTAHYWHVR